MLIQTAASDKWYLCYQAMTKIRLTLLDCGRGHLRRAERAAAMEDCWVVAGGIYANRQAAEDEHSKSHRHICTTWRTPTISVM